mmetsp:Transcript_34944/g.47145  ORF Transcript_34944/g.47145 Transcript_34944/m.47145 type:complete len:278 (-) Transcript_34944:472-1305(-)
MPPPMPMPMLGIGGHAAGGRIGSPIAPAGTPTPLPAQAAKADGGDVPIPLLAAASEGAAVGCGELAGAVATTGLTPTCAPRLAMDSRESAERPSSAEAVHAVEAGAVTCLRMVGGRAAATKSSKPPGTRAAGVGAAVAGGEGAGAAENAIQSSAATAAGGGAGADEKAAHSEAAGVGAEAAELNVDHEPPSESTLAESEPLIKPPPLSLPNASIPLPKSAANVAAGGGRAAGADANDSIDPSRSMLLAMEVGADDDLVAGASASGAAGVSENQRRSS